MNHVLGLACLICGARYTPSDAEYVCPHHGDDGILDVVYDYTAIGRRVAQAGIEPFGSGGGIWRYRALLPVRPDSPAPPLAVGDTPLYSAPRLATELGLRALWVKDDGRQASASFKDRASAMAVVKAREKRAEIIATASTGNAAAALACICASVKQRNIIFVPASAPPAKIVQLLVYGSTVLLVDGTYDDAFELCLEACREFGWYNRNTAYNPYMTEGKKTVVYEVCEQLGGAEAALESARRDGGAGGGWVHHRRCAQGAQGSAGAGDDRAHAARRRRASGRIGLHVAGLEPGGGRTHQAPHPG